MKSIVGMIMAVVSLMATVGCGPKEADYQKVSDDYWAEIIKKDAIRITIKDLDTAKAAITTLNELPDGMSPITERMKAMSPPPMKIKMKIWKEHQDRMRRAMAEFPSEHGEFMKQFKDSHPEVAAEYLAAMKIGNESARAGIREFNRLFGQEKK